MKTIRNSENKLLIRVMNIIPMFHNFWWRFHAKKTATTMIWSYYIVLSVWLSSITFFLFKHFFRVADPEQKNRISCHKVATPKGHQTAPSWGRDDFFFHPNIPSNISVIFFINAWFMVPSKTLWQKKVDKNRVTVTPPPFQCLQLLCSQENPKKNGAAGHPYRFFLR